MSPEPFSQIQYCVFVDREDGPHGIASGVTADSALTKATLYYYRMNDHDHNDMDMTEIDRFYIRTREVSYSAMTEEKIPASQVVTEYNPWYEKHWK